MIEGERKDKQREKQKNKGKPKIETKRFVCKTLLKAVGSKKLP